MGQWEFGVSAQCGWKFGSRRRSGFPGVCEGEMVTASLFQRVRVINESCESSLCSNYNLNDSSTSQICICHNSSAVVIWAKLRSDCIVICHISNMGLWTHWPFVKWFPDVFIENDVISWGDVEIHDDVIKLEHLSRYWSFVRGIHRSPVNFPHKGQWRGALKFSLVCAWINCWVNALRRHRVHHNVTQWL